MKNPNPNPKPKTDEQMDGKEWNHRTFPGKPKPKPNNNLKPNLNPKPHGPTIKGTPRAQKQNLDKSHENMEIKKIKNVFIGPAGPN